MREAVIRSQRLVTFDTLRTATVSCNERHCPAADGARVDGNEHTEKGGDQKGEPVIHDDGDQHCCRRYGGKID